MEEQQKLVTVMLKGVVMVNDVIIHHAHTGLCLCRPVDKALRKKCKLPPVRKVWTVDDKLGGWAETQKHFFDEKVCSTLLSTDKLLHGGLWSGSVTDTAINVAAISECTE